MLRPTLLLFLCLRIPEYKAASTIEKSIISYLDSNYLMLDGCPEPICNDDLEECRRIRNMVRVLYSHCLQSEDGQHLGCITDRFGANSESLSLTLPVYATLCSAMCYESTPEKLAKIHRCPHPGYRQHDPLLNHIFK